MRYVEACRAETFLDSLAPGSVDLFAIDPPYFGIVEGSWDNAWSNEDAYVAWLVDLLERSFYLLAPHGSLILFGGIGKHGSHPLFRILAAMEAIGYTFRNWITWQKRRAYGKSHDYLFCREEILWFSRSPERTNVRFDIPELMKPERTAQKPESLLGRIIETHSNANDLVVDYFAGWGTTGVAALKRSRRFWGCEAIEADAEAANARCVEAIA